MHHSNLAVHRETFIHHNTHVRVSMYVRMVINWPCVLLWLDTHFEYKIEKILTDRNISESDPLVNPGSAKLCHERTSPVLESCTHKPRPDWSGQWPPLPVCNQTDVTPCECECIWSELSNKTNRIGEIHISPIRTCLSLSDWQRKTLIIVIFQKTIFCDVDSASQLAGVTWSITSCFVYRS